MAFRQSSTNPFSDKNAGLLLSGPLLTYYIDILIKKLPF